MNYPVQMLHFQDDCEAKLLQAIDQIPVTRERKIVELNRTL